MKSVPTLVNLLESHGDSTMLIHNDVPLTFAQILDQSSRVATGFERLGVRAGDRVAIWLPTMPAWFACFFACARLGAIAVAVNTRFLDRELTDTVARSGARVLVYWPGFPKVDYASILATCNRATMPHLETIVACEESGDQQRKQAAQWPSFSFRTLAAAEPILRDDSQPASPCIIFTTSGTTKAPKFVMHDQQTIVRHALDVARNLGMHSSSLMLLMPPLCGVFGFCWAMVALAAGRPLITAAVWDPAAAARCIDQYGVTHVHGTDDAFAQLLAQNNRIPAFPTLEFSGYGALNPAQKDIMVRADERGLRLVQLYGASEIQALVARQSETAPPHQRALAGGRLVSPLARVRARDVQTGTLQPHGQPGELEILAPSSRMVGYFGDAEATAAAFTSDGWYRTGDLGYTQEDGRFVFLGRLGDSMRLGGFQVSPLEIENVIKECAGVAACQVVDAVVTGAPRAIAFVRLEARATLDEADVVAHAAVRLARYKVPARVFTIDDFPTAEGPNGPKIQKHKLREMAQKSIDLQQGDRA